MKKLLLILVAFIMINATHASENPVSKFQFKKTFENLKVSLVRKSMQAPSPCIAWYDASMDAAYQQYLTSFAACSNNINCQSVITSNYFNLQQAITAAWLYCEYSLIFGILIPA